MGGCLRTVYGLALWHRLATAALLSLLLVIGRSQAAESEAAATSDAVRDEARRAIPLDKIDPAYRNAVREVIGNPSLFRRLPTNVIDCHPHLFTFLAQNPEVLVEIWRHLGVSRVELSRLDDTTFRISDGAGTTGKLVVVEQSCDASAQNRIVMLAEGSYEGKPFQRPISAQCVIVLTSGSTEETNGRRFVASRIDSFIKLDRMSLELVAKAVHPFIGQTADRNFADTLSFVSTMSFTAENRPASIEKLAVEVENLDKARREALMAHARACHDAGNRWQASRARQVSAEIPPQ